MGNNLNIFVCTKPLQIMIAMNLSKQLVTPCALYVVDAFSSAESLVNSTMLRTFFCEVRLFKKRSTAVVDASRKKPSSIFIDSDIGLKTQLALFLSKIYSPKSSLNVYEEGVGTCRTDIVPSILKRLIYRAAGTATCFGGSVFTDNIFVFNRARYCLSLPRYCSKAVSISQSHLKFLLTNYEVLVSIFGLGYCVPKSINGSRAYVYLTDWEISRDVVMEFNIYPNAFVKPHPHISESVVQVFQDMSLSNWVPASYPAELLIYGLSLRFSEVYVRHNGSSVMHYLEGLNNVVSF